MSSSAKKKESQKLNCVICHSSVVEEVSIKDKPKSTLSSSSRSSSSNKGARDEEVLFEKFCEEFLSLEEKATATTTFLWRDLPVCSECSESISSVMDTNSRLEVVKGRVRKLEQKLLDELKEVQLFVDLLGWQLKKLEKCSKEGSGAGEGHSKDSKKRGKGRPSRKDNEMVEAGQIVRKSITNVTKDLLHYRGTVKDKASCIGKGTSRSPRKRKRRSSPDTQSDHDSDNHRPYRRRHTKSPRMSTSPEPQTNDRFGGDSSGSESASGSEYLPDPDSPSSRISGAGGTYDNDDDTNSEGIVRRSSAPNSKVTLRIKEVVKSEPASEPEFENEEGEPNLDEIKAKDLGGEKYVLCETSGKIKPGKEGLPRESFVEQPGSWSEINISEEELKEDFRVDKKIRSKGFNQTRYYCAHAARLKGKSSCQCPVRIKVKELANGVRLILHNNFEHANHRTESVGLTKEQRLFVEDCLKKGVTKPVGIFESFRHCGMDAPAKLKLQNFLQNHRKRIIPAELAPKQEDELGVGVAVDAGALTVPKDGANYDREPCPDSFQMNNDNPSVLALL